MQSTMHVSKTFPYIDTGGDKPVIVFLHGVLTDGRLWAEVVDGLKNDYRCIVPELPFGCHPFPMPDAADLSIQGVVGLVAAFLEELNLQNVTLVSNDWGGAQLLISEGKYERVAKLVLVSCEAFDNYPPGLPGKLLCLNASIPGGTFLTAQLLRSRFLRHLPLTFGRMSKKHVPDALFLSWIEPLRKQVKIRRDLNKYLTQVPAKQTLLEWAEKQRKFDGPVLIVWAKEDYLMPAKHAEKLRDHFPNARLEWVSDSYTLIPIDQPQTLIRILRAFMESTPLKVV